MGQCQQGLQQILDTEYDEHPNNAMRRSLTDGGGFVLDGQGTEPPRDAWKELASKYLPALLGNAGSVASTSRTKDGSTPQEVLSPRSGYQSAPARSFVVPLGPPADAEDGALKVYSNHSSLDDLPDSEDIDKAPASSPFAQLSQPRTGYWRVQLRPSDGSNALTLLSGPNVSCEAILQVPAGEEGVCTFEDGCFAQVNWKGHEGWIAVADLTFLPTMG
mmetsp:Transcript_21505/g.46040  ORF Transcript_21505/g.46040 Transcript_21505/m.46040 type:complete len:218 (-) Transcript_21505:16-669(-)